MIILSRGVEDTGSMGIDVETSTVDGGWELH